MSSLATGICRPQIGIYSDAVGYDSCCFTVGSIETTYIFFNNRDITQLATRANQGGAFIVAIQVHIAAAQCFEIIVGIDDNVRI